MLYKTKQFSVGLNVSTPSVGGIYSDGKSLMRKRSQSNITDPNTGNSIPDYLISDYKEKKEVSVNSKNPLSIAAGLTYYNPNKSKVFYFTMEYFAKIDQYRMVKTNESLNASSETLFGTTEGDDWLTFIDGAKSVFNAGLGYRWIINDDLMILSGFRTDYNPKNKPEFNSYTYSKTVKGFYVNKYHLTSGLTLRLFGNYFIMGLQYTFGHKKNQTQFTNLSDPVEFNYEENKALQGTRQNTMTTILNTVSLYFGATININERENSILNSK